MPSSDNDSMCITSWLHSRKQAWCDLLAVQTNVNMLNFVVFQNSLFFIGFYSIFSLELCVKMELMRMTDRDKSTDACIEMLQKCKIRPMESRWWFFPSENRFFRHRIRRMRAPCNFLRAKKNLELKMLSRYGWGA